MANAKDARTRTRFTDDPGWVNPARLPSVALVQQQGEKPAVKATIYAVIFGIFA